MAQNIDLKSRIPNYLRNEVLDSIFSNLFNRFVSQDDSIQVAGNIGNTTDIKISATDLEHEINALVPAIIYSVGAEDRLFVFDDLINKLEALGVDTVSLRSWMAEQQFNFIPPIDLDKFVNYGSYRWVGDPEKDDIPSWNPDLTPEYYVIAKPAPTDSDKWPVKLASTRHLNLWANDRPLETFTVEFIDADTFTVTSDIDPTLDTTPTINFVDGIADITLTSVDPGPSSTTTNSLNPSIGIPSIGESAGTVYNVVSFSVVQGTTPFAAGDQFIIRHVHFTSQTTIEFVGQSVTGKGSISGVRTRTPMMKIDGITINDGDRILVKNQISPIKNGIYVVSTGGKWRRVTDADADDELNIGDRVFVTHGLKQFGRTYDVTDGPPDGTLDDTAEVQFGVRPDLEPVTRIMISMDNSGSMSGTKMNTLKSAMHQTLDTLQMVIGNGAGYDLEIHLQRWSSSATYLSKSTFEPSDWTDMHNFITAMVASGNTDSADAFAGAPTFFQSGVPAKNVMIVIADGDFTDNMDTTMATIADLYDRNNDPYSIASGDAVLIKGVGILTAGDLAEFDNTGEDIPVLMDENDADELQYIILGVLRNNVINPFNKWQVYNHWIHINDMTEMYPDRLTSAPRATRPIIEYDRYLHLAGQKTANEKPTDGTLEAISYQQEKTRFNQIPLFDLYYYDGHHSGHTSGIWYYMEDQTYPVDPVIKRRLKTTQNSDFVFGHSMKDLNGRFLYYKKDDELYNAWSPGITTSAASDVIINSEAITTSVSVSVGSDADQQRYIITMISDTEYSIEGSRSGSLGTGTINVQKTFGDVTVTVENDPGSSVQEFTTGDVMTFNVYAKQAPRYVKKV